jgi:hypothetical protein
VPQPRLHLHTQPLQHPQEASRLRLHRLPFAPRRSYMPTLAVSP